MQRVDVIDVIKKLRSISQKAKKIEPETLDLGQRVLENRIMVLEGYMNFLDKDAVPVLKKIVEDLDDLGEKVYIGGPNHD